VAGKSGWHKLSDAERLNRILANRQARMERVDAMSPEMRELVNHYGLTIIDTCIALGVARPRQIKHLVETVLDEFSPTRGSYSRQGVRTEVAGGGR
jgi:glutamine phosphoribosylpyrophosphate amidotransferase